MHKWAARSSFGHMAIDPYSATKLGGAIRYELTFIWPYKVS
jgi:hypothetical protein